MQLSSARPNPYQRFARQASPVPPPPVAPPPTAEPPAATPTRAAALTHTVIRLRPAPGLLPRAPAPPDDRAGGSPPPPEPHPARRRALRRWLLVYLPLVLLVGAVLYVVCELAMKHLAVRTLHDQLLALPERPTQPPPISVSLAKAPPPPPPPAASADLHSRAPAPLASLHWAFPYTHSTGS